MARLGKAASQVPECPCQACKMPYEERFGRYMATCGCESRDLVRATSFICRRCGNCTGVHCRCDLMEEDAALEPVGWVPPSRRRHFDIS